MRLLCLHGMYQNAAVFRTKMEPLHVALPHLQLVYLDGPTNLVPKVVSKPIDTTVFRAWWDPDQTTTTQAQRQIIDYVGDAIATSGPFDGVLGFSQGASLASWLCSSFAQRQLGWSPSVAIFLGGYLHSTTDEIFSNGLVPHVRSFHAFGLNDRVVPASKSEVLAALFEQGTRPDLVARYSHGHGHIVPKCDGTMHALQSFLHAMPSPSSSSPPPPSHVDDANLGRASISASNL
ncbi:unnamed protein product [Aphanomyces euteiches]|uniref:Serine hydrolase domain-containing protein n=1 Tax=Aphanomyces euteiches TaxID=100861 RepID=A0A6G0XID3_9STRA|nr:hypothetical protein Ae201684_004479 [Aphanomyces euteiches]KAH9093794.1 hypothetical protein Ae201684P_016416 [Aphanomyces euteiches]KAH9154327.1 hypothetical protein AeRB84_003572 [Aphanomyces euteiches]